MSRSTEASPPSILYSLTFVEVHNGTKAKDVTRLTDSRNYSVRPFVRGLFSDLLLVLCLFVLMPVSAYDCIVLLLSAREGLFLLDRYLLKATVRKRENSRFDSKLVKQKKKQTFLSME